VAGDLPEPLRTSRPGFFAAWFRLSRRGGAVDLLIELRAEIEAVREEPEGKARPRRCETSPRRWGFLWKRSKVHWPL
jgi:hypothetical protein